MQRAVLGWVLLSRWLYEQHRSDMSGRAVQLVRRQQLSAVFIGTIWRDGRSTDVELHRSLSSRSIWLRERTHFGDVQWPVLSGVLLSRRVHQLHRRSMPARSVQLVGRQHLHAVSLRSIRINS